jgi:surface carbohydrate biosynthesis protein
MPPRARPRTILLLVPYRSRDLEGHALVAYHLERRFGHRVILANSYNVERKLLRHAPDVLVLDHLVWPEKIRQTRLAHELGIRVLVLETEGLWQDTEMPARRAGKYQGVGEAIDTFFAWGDLIRDAVIEQGVLRPEQVARIGCPRFDFYVEPYRSAMVEPRERFLARMGITNPDAPLIVWATNTTYAARNQRKMLRRQVRKGKLPADEVRRELEDEVTQLREHSAAVLELARRHPDWNFVIKVHPAEWLNPYPPLTRQAPNLHLAYDAPIRDFLVHCSALLQRGCTTATEAWILDRPVLELAIGTYHLQPQPEYLAASHVVATVDEADAALQAYVAGLPIPPEQARARAEFIATWYYRVDGRSSERCAEVIDARLTGAAYTDEDQDRTAARVQAAHAAWREREDRRLVNRLKARLGIDREVSLRFWKRLTRWEARDNLGLFTAEPEITPEMVAGLYHRFDEVRATPTLLESSVV